MGNGNRDGAGAIAQAVFYSFGGALVSGILTLHQFHPDVLDRICDGLGGCEAAQQSHFAWVGPVPVAKIGLSFYLAILLASLCCMAMPATDRRRKLLAACSIAGVAALLGSVLLTLAQFLAVKAFCPLCTLSAVLCLFLTCALVSARRAAIWPAQMRGAMLLAAALAVIAALTFVGLRAGTASQIRLLARVNGKPITSFEMEQDDPPGLQQAAQAQYRVQREWLDERIVQLLLEQEAARRGTTTQALLNAEVQQKIEPLLAEARQRHDKALDNETDIRWQRYRQFISELRQRYAVETFLPKPPSSVLEYDPALAHVRGFEGAPIHLVVFTEFECPYCAQLSQVLDRVMEKYPLTVSLTLLQMPMDFHPLSRPAADAAECAGEQGRFWEYHDRLMTVRRQGQLEPQWEAYAADVGLDMASFKVCMGSDRIKARVEKSRKAGEAMGLTGVPAVYLNGRRIGGAMEFDELCSLIDAEKQRLR